MNQEGLGNDTYSKIAKVIGDLGSDLNLYLNSCSVTDQNEYLKMISLILTKSINVTNQTELVNLLTTFISEDCFSNKQKQKMAQDLFRLAQRQVLSPDVIRPLMVAMGVIVNNNEIFTANQIARAREINTTLEERLSNATSTSNLTGYLPNNINAILDKLDIELKEKVLDGFYLDGKEFKKPLDVSLIQLSVKGHVNDVLWGNCKSKLLTFPESKEFSYLNSFFENLMTSQEVKIKGAQSIRGRVVAIIDYIEKALPEDRKKILEILNYGGEACVDKSITALEDAEIEIALKNIPEDNRARSLASVLICNMKRNIVKSIIWEYDKNSENVETYLYHFLQLNSVLGLSSTISSMNYPGIAKVISFQTFMKKFYGNLDSNLLINNFFSDERWVDFLDKEAARLSQLPDENIPEYAKAYINIALGPKNVSTEDQQKIKNEFYLDHTKALLIEFGYLKSIE